MSDLTDPIADIIGDYRGFAAQQRDRLLTRAIDIAPYTLSHLAPRSRVGPIRPSPDAAGASRPVGNREGALETADRSR